MATKLGFSIESSLASNHLTDAKYIKGGFFVVKDTSDRDALVVATDTQDGTIVDGSLCYCQADGKFYQHNGNTWAEKNFSEGGGSGGGEQGTPRATNYVFEHTDGLYAWLATNRDKLVKGDAFYIGNVPWIDDTEKAFPDYIWDGTALKETIMPFAKLPLPVWLDEGDGSMKKTLSLLDIGIPDWMGEMSVAAERDGNFQNCRVFISSVNGVLADFEDIHDYAKKDDIPTHLSQLDEDATHRVVTDTEKATWNAKSNFSGDYNALTNKPTIPTVPINVSAFNNDANYATKDDIPSDAHINTLIDSALGGIIDGTVKF